jgi:hypothetical protein
MLSSREDQAERRRVLQNDARVREQGGSAYIGHYTQEAGGRLLQVASAQVVGASALPSYPAAAAHQRDPVGQEPALGYSVNDLTPSELDPSMVSACLDAQAGPADDAPSNPLNVERSAGPPRKPSRRF